MMRKFIFLLGALLFTGCSYNNIASVSNIRWNYLPLEIGNSWDFQYLNGPAKSELHKEVVGTGMFNNYQYYLLVTTSTSTAHADSAYYRIDNNGLVYIHTREQGYFDSNRFRLNANNGDFWTYPVDNFHLATIKATTEPLTIGNSELENCKSYYYDVPNESDEENTISLAPGIGFVKEYGEYWGVVLILKEAKIHGQVLNF